LLWKNRTLETKPTEQSLTVEINNHALSLGNGSGHAHGAETVLPNSTFYSSDQSVKL